MRCGLLGAKLTHSYSPFIHSQLGNYTYELFEKSPEELDIFLHSADFSGLNVTIPYKKSVIPFCDELTPIAAKLNAVNTIIRREDGTLLGHNTDYYGFSSMLEKSGISVKGKKVLVLGSGGASATVVEVLKGESAQVIVISRTGENNYSNLHLHKDASMIVNATPVGMYPNNASTPILLDGFPNLEGVLDLIYNPARTALLMNAQKRGIVAMNGLWMLVAQAVESAKMFLKKEIPDSCIPEIHKLLSNTVQNIVLIGMPGCGKTTVGKLLAAKLNRDFVDSDSYIEKNTGLSITQIFQRFGETGFRDIESRALEELGAKSGIVLATGGGCITRSDNYAMLHQNGNIYYLNRDLHKLPTEGRPLSQQSGLEKLYQDRALQYLQFADHIIDNNQDIDSTVNAIIHQEDCYENSRP